MRLDPGGLGAPVRACGRWRRAMVDEGPGPTGQLLSELPRASAWKR
jgi:hypothetical protein